MAWVGRAVQVRGCAATVEIYVEDRCVTRYPRHTACRVSSIQVISRRPRPPGRLARQIVLPRSWDWQAPVRPLDGYAALVERAGRRG